MRRQRCRNEGTGGRSGASRDEGAPHRMNIGTLRVEALACLAPMAGITDLPFRLVCREHGCALAFTEMVSAKGLCRGMAKTRHYLDSLPADRPLGVQLFGTEPATLAEAARIVTDLGADLVDINMGCPVRKVVRAGAGAALLKDLPLVAAILNAVRPATPLPLTIKIRSGWNRRSLAALEVGRIAADCGVDAVVLHGRTADQGFSGAADWQLIGELKAALRIPVIGNGDIRTAGDAARMAAQTGCDAVMIGRGARGNPWIFASVEAIRQGRQFREPSAAERREVILAHLERAVSYWRFEEQAVRNFRKHLLWYTKGVRAGARFRSDVAVILREDRLREAIHAFFDAAGEEPAGGGPEDE